MPTNVSVLIAVPTMGSVHPILVQRLLKWGRRDDVSFYFTFKVAPVDRARNQIVEFFLRGRFSYLLMIDSDTIPPEDALDRLLSHGKPIVSGMTPILSYKEEGGYQSYDNCFVSLDTDEHGKVVSTHVASRNTGLQEIFRCGAACILIERNVFQMLDKPYYRFITNAENTAHTKSEDIDFCDRARAAGLTLYADTHVICQHYKDIML